MLLAAISLSISTRNFYYSLTVPAPDFGGSYSRRNYSDRVIQAVDATYGTEKLHIEETAVNLGFSYPINKNFRLKMSSTFGRSTSNNNYEAVYRYNYDNSNDQLGFTYDY